MMAHQAVGSAVLLALATWALRPAFRRGDGSAKRRQARTRAGRLLTRRWRPRPPVGDDAMLWKETQGTPGSRLVALVSILTALAVVMIGYDSFKTTIPRSWQAFRLHGYRLDDADPRHVLGIELRVAAAGLFGVWSLLLMIASATSISREREDDTWTSLVSTPLSGREILRAKLLGAAWSCRHLAYAILGVIAFGVALGATHPLGALLAGAQLAAFGLFVSAAGTLISIRMRTTSAALGLGVVVLVALDLIAPIILGVVVRENGALPLLPSQPILIALGMLTPRNLEEIRRYLWSNDVERWSPRIREVVFTAAIGSLAYLALGPILLAWAYRRFDRLLDRPRRPLISFAPGHPTSAAPAGAARASLPAGRAG
jgi:ABC-type transport system involved in multi-copper enzyme maturation permease subunit